MSDKKMILLKAWIVFCEIWPGEIGTQEGKHIKTRSFWKAWKEFETLPPEVDYKLCFQKAAEMEKIRGKQQTQGKPLLM